MPKKATAKKATRKTAKKVVRNVAKATKKPAKVKKPAKAKNPTVKKIKAKATIKQKVDMSKVKPITSKLTKTQIIAHISEQTGVSKAEVTEVFKALAVCIHGQMKTKGFGEFTIPETGVKVRRIRKPATKSRKMISPFTGQEITVKAKPARNVVKLSALKALKESVNK